MPRKKARPPTRLNSFLIPPARLWTAMPRRRSRRRGSTRPHSTRPSAFTAPQLSLRHARTKKPSPLFLRRGFRGTNDGWKLLGLRELRDVRLGASGSVLVNDARLRGLVHGRGVSRTSSLGRSGITGLGSHFELLVKGLQAGFDRLVAGGEALSFASGFDGRFGVGHDV
jgi:hypothetical protein